MGCEIKYCESCAKTKKNVYIPENIKTAEFKKGFMVGYGEDVKICPFCETPLKDVPITSEDFSTIQTVSDYNRELLEAMIALKEKDVIEYELKMSQFRTQAEQIEKLQSQSNVDKTRVTCPNCGSTDTVHGTKGFSFFTGFFGSGDYRRVCVKCGHKWKPGSLSESIDRAISGHK